MNAVFTNHDKRPTGKLGKPRTPKYIAGPGYSGFSGSSPSGVRTGPGPEPGLCASTPEQRIIETLHPNPSRTNAKPNIVFPEYFP
ncbi:hypothetical protein L596_030281 [Steinernema carpocapsae]|uniref:Uncharacterized protein n=1 Tax=Steinernema carpocapsae TaxID=34508 RepID=A0A4U5LNZ6_STECR|nr:hypothetical protein L596_030281 [Steinernema carpocapsae]